MENRSSSQLLSKQGQKTIKQAYNAYGVTAEEVQAPLRQSLRNKNSGLRNSKLSASQSSQNDLKKQKNLQKNTLPKKSSKNRYEDLDNEQSQQSLNSKHIMNQLQDESERAPNPTNQNDSMKNIGSVKTSEQMFNNVISQNSTARALQASERFHTFGKKNSIVLSPSTEKSMFGTNKNEKQIKKELDDIYCQAMDVMTSGREKEQNTSRFAQLHSEIAASVKKSTIQEEEKTLEGTQNPLKVSPSTKSRKKSSRQQVSNTMRNPEALIKRDSMKNGSVVSPWEGSRPSMPLNDHVYENLQSNDSTSGPANMTPGANFHKSKIDRNEQNITSQSVVHQDIDRLSQTEMDPKHAKQAASNIYNNRNGSLADGTINSLYSNNNHINSQVFKQAYQTQGVSLNQNKQSSVKNSNNEQFTQHSSLISAPMSNPTNISKLAPFRLKTHRKLQKNIYNQKLTATSMGAITNMRKQSIAQNITNISMNHQETAPKYLQQKEIPNIKIDDEAINLPKVMVKRKINPQRQKDSYKKHLLRFQEARMNSQSGLSSQGSNSPKKSKAKLPAMNQMGTMEQQADMTSLNQQRYNSVNNRTRAQTTDKQGKRPKPRLQPIVNNDKSFRHITNKEDILSSGAAGVSENQFDILSGNGTKKNWIRNFEYNSSTGNPNALQSSMLSSGNKFYSNLQSNLAVQRKDKFNDKLEEILENKKYQKLPLVSNKLRQKEMSRSKERLESTTGGISGQNSSQYAPTENLALRLNMNQQSQNTLRSHNMIQQIQMPQKAKSKFIQRRGERSTSHSRERLNPRNFKLGINKDGDPNISPMALEINDEGYGLTKLQKKRLVELVIKRDMGLDKKVEEHSKKQIAEFNLILEEYEQRGGNDTLQTTLKNIQTRMDKIQKELDFYSLSNSQIIENYIQ